MQPQISITDLYSLKKKKDRMKAQTFNLIIERCHKKITTIASQGGENIFFEIPYIMLGYPLYNIDDCVEYVVLALRNNGLLVQILPHPNNHTLYISWKPCDVNNTGPKKQLTSSRLF